MVATPSKFVQKGTSGPRTCKIQASVNLSERAVGKQGARAHLGGEGATPQQGELVAPTGALRIMYV